MRKIHPHRYWTVPNYKNTLTITGKLTDNNKNTIKNTIITLNINGKKYKTKTNNKGTYTYKYKTNKRGNNKITVTYNGNTNYKASTNSTTFTVTKKNTTLTIYHIPNTHYTDTVKIHGKLSTKDENLNGRQIILKINGNTVTRKTNEEGIYRYEYKTKIPGKNNITATYKGNNYYQMVKTSKTFKVTRMPTLLSMEEVSTSTLGKKKTITGELYNDNYEPLKNTRIHIYFNGGKKTVKTDAYGYFSYTFTTKKAGKNTITAQYIGTNKYIGSKQTITFDVNKMNSYTSLYQPDYDKTNKIIYIRGNVYDNQNNYMKKAPVTININGKYYKTTTDNYGYFSYQAKPTKTGTNTITATYPGNNKYTKSSDKTTINIPIVKATKITLDPISTTNLGNYVYITGQFTDNNYNALKHSNIKLTINGKNYNTKTDEYGYYYYSYKTNKAGTNKVTATFKGNNNYKASSTTKTFTVTKYKKVTLKIDPPLSLWHVTYIDGDPFIAHYETGGQYDAGAYAEISYRQDYKPAVNTIVKTTFYYKNRYGDVITNTGSKYYYKNVFRAPLISGYTPYKVDIYYTK